MTTNPYEPPQSGQPFGGAAGADYARAKVQTPAMALMIFAIIFGILQGLALVANMLGVGLTAAAGPEGAEGAAALGQGVVGVIASIVGMIVAGVIVYGAMKMKNLEARGLAMTAAVLAAVPCVSPCCIIGLPIGIWAIMVLNDPQVKAVYP